MSLEKKNKNDTSQSKIHFIKLFQIILFCNNRYKFLMVVLKSLWIFPSFSLTFNSFEGMMPLYLLSLYIKYCDQTGVSLFKLLYKCEHVKLLKRHSSSYLHSEKQMKGLEVTYRKIDISMVQIFHDWKYLLRNFLKRKDNYIDFPWYCWKLMVSNSFWYTKSISKYLIL